MRLLIVFPLFLAGCLFVEEDVSYYHHPRPSYYSPGVSYTPRYYAPGQYGVGMGVAPRYRAQGYYNQGGYDDDRRYVHPRRYYDE
jgi:hypothetical protein